MNDFIEADLASIVSDNMLQDVRKVQAGVYGFEWVEGSHYGTYTRWVMQARGGSWQWTLAALRTNAKGEALEAQKRTVEALFFARNV